MDMIRVTLTSRIKSLFAKCILFLAVSSTLSLSANTLYWAGGTNDIADGTPLPTDLANLAGTWDTTLKNWATDSSGTTYTNWTSGADVTASFATAVTTKSISYPWVMLAADITLNTIYIDYNINSYNYGVLFDAVSEQTITLAGDAPTIMVEAGHASRRTRFEPNVKLAGSSDCFIGDGGGDFELESDSSGLTGKLT